MEATQGEKKPRGNGPVQITVVRGNHLKGAKGGSTVTYVRLEFNNVHLGDSPKHELSADQVVEYNFTTSFECNAEGPISLDDVAHKPVILTVIEVLPKEKKT